MDIQQNEIDDKNARLAERMLGDMRSVLNSAEGRRVIWDIMAQARVFIGGFAGEAAHFRDGQQDIGLYVLQRVLSARPGAFEQMQREYASELKQTQREEEKRREEAN